VQAAVFGNVGSVLACRTGASDAPFIATQIGLGGADALLDLPNFTAWARLLTGGVPTSPLRISLFDAPPALEPAGSPRTGAPASRGPKPEPPHRASVPGPIVTRARATRLALPL
jgi:hypothetical protein